MLTHLDLFSGVGGFALACEWAGIETIGFVEIDKYCQKVLRKHWSDVPIVEDIRDVEQIKGIVTNATGEGCLEKQPEAGILGEAICETSTGQPSRADRLSRISGATATRIVTIQPAILVTAGFPCQPFSVAGKQLSQADDRYLWPQTIAVIKEINPQWVLLENVTGIINLALDTVLSDLEGAGYAYETLIIPACAVNAWHRRDRVWIVAYPECERNGGKPRDCISAKGTVQNRATRFEESWPYQVGNGSQDDADSQRTGLEGTDAERDLCTTGQPLQPCEDVANTTDRLTQSSGAQCHVGRLEDQVLRTGRDTDNWAVEPELGRVAHGIPRRVDRLKCLGNAIVPQVAYEIIKVIAEIERIV